MRDRKITLVTAVAFLLCSSAASATSISHSIRGGLAADYQVSDTLVVDVFLDADPDISALSVSVNFEASIFGYSSAASKALPVIYGAPSALYGTTGAAPGYILYDAGSGPGSSATFLEPLQNPFVTWPGYRPEGIDQVNINYSHPAFVGTVASGTGIWIASLALHVEQPFLETEIALSLTAGGNIVADGAARDITESVGLSAPITVLASGNPPPPDDGGGGVVLPPPPPPDDGGGGVVLPPPDDGGGTPTSAVPEPSAALLFAAGWLVVARRLRRRR